ncbi:hypothetical protein LKM2_1098 [Leptospira kirschneri serovar Mozdok]|nr:hypothetical protein [Leptospira kirschneri serovar Mozdok]
MIIAYSLNITDNDSYMYGSGFSLFEILPKLYVCLSCGYRKSLNWDNPFFELKKPYIDFSYTYDGICIVSQRVIYFMFRFQYENDVEWVRLKNFPNFYTFLPHRSVASDSNRRQTRFEKQCKICGFYESVTGATPVFLKGISSRLIAAFIEPIYNLAPATKKVPS